MHAPIVSLPKATFVKEKNGLGSETSVFLLQLLGLATSKH